MQYSILRKVLWVYSDSYLIQKSLQYTIFHSEYISDTIVAQYLMYNAKVSKNKNNNVKPNMNTFGQQVLFFPNIYIYIQASVWAKYCYPPPALPPNKILSFKEIKFKCNTACTSSLRIYIYSTHVDEYYARIIYNMVSDYSRICTRRFALY